MNTAAKSFFTALTAVTMLFLSNSSVSRAALFTGTSGTLSAEADFQLSGTTLTITLTNTGVSTNNPTLLHGLYFNVTGSPTLTAGTANLVSGSTQVNLNGTAYVGSEVAANGWGFVQGSAVSSKVAGENYAIL